MANGRGHRPLANLSEATPPPPRRVPSTLRGLILLLHVLERLPLRLVSVRPPILSCNSPHRKKVAPHGQEDTLPLLLRSDREGMPCRILEVELSVMGIVSCGQRESACLREF